MLNSDNKIVYKELSRFNNKSGFWISIFVQSKWNNKFINDDNNLLTYKSDANNTKESKIFKELIRKLNKLTQSFYDDFLRNHVDLQIKKYEEEGFFPSYLGEDEDYANWKLRNPKSLIKNIYIADPTIFSTLNKKQTKIIIRLLDKLSTSSNNDSLFDILEIYT